MRPTDTSTDNSESNAKWRWTFGIAGIACVAIGTLAAVGLWTGAGARSPEARADASSTTEVEDPLQAARSFYEGRPFYQRPRWNPEVPEGLPNTRAETCGSCHEAIYEEWKISTHRRAWKQDPQFLAELEKSRHGRHAGGRDDVGWMCVTCHTPNVRQLDRLVVGLEDGDIGQPTYVDNPLHDPEMQDDAITCATCHVSDGKVYGPWGTTDAPHPTAKAESLRTTENCTQCHQATQEWPNRNLGCYFNTGKQHAESKYADQGETCQSCHMPTVHRKLAEGYDRPKRKTRRHWFGGSLIAKGPEYADELEQLESVYGSGAEIDVLGDPPVAPNRSKHGHLETSECTVDDCRTVWIRVTNTRAGHKLPTGDPERHIDLRAVAKTPEGEPLTRAEFRIASKYEWWPDIEKLYDNRPAPDEYRDVPLRIPADAERVVIDVRADKYRMYMEAFEHHDLEETYVRGRDFHRSRWTWSPDGVERTFLADDRRSEGETPDNFLEPEKGGTADASP